MEYIENIVLCSIENLQEYIFDNIDQLIKLNYKNIYIITNKKFKNNFKNLKNFKNFNIKLIFIEDYNDSYKYLKKSKLNKGFWQLTSARFFYIYSFLKKNNIKSILHIENDVLIYNKLDKNLFNDNKIYMPFDTYERNIASIMYIPDADSLEYILNNYDYEKNDMYNFSKFIKKNIINNFPIFNDEENINKEIQFVSNNFNKFKFIFDAAAIGQYIGGTHKDNNIKFINEKCIIKYNLYEILWVQDNIKRPFIKINNIIYPIFNLHIHSKQLKLFKE